MLWTAYRRERPAIVAKPTVLIRQPPISRSRSASHPTDLPTDLPTYRPTYRPTSRPTDDPLAASTPPPESRRYPPVPKYPPIAFYSAIRLGDPEQLAKVMETDPYFITQDNGAGAPVHFATTYKQLDMLHHLLNNGAEINQRDEKGFTPLHRAVCINSPSLVPARRATRPTHHSLPFIIVSRSRPISPTTTATWRFTSTYCPGEPIRRSRRWVLTSTDVPHPTPSDSPTRATRFACSPGGLRSVPEPGSEDPDRRGHRRGAY